MLGDKQLRGIALEEVLKKRALDQALNAKETAVLAGVSYSTARQWIRSPGFPALRGVVFWSDFIEWGDPSQECSRPESNRLMSAGKIKLSFLRHKRPCCPSVLSKFLATQVDQPAERRPI